MVSVIILRILWASGLAVVALMIAIASRYHFTNAHELCQRWADGAERMPRILHFLFPPRLYRSRYCVFGVRSTGIAGLFMAALLFVVSLLILFGHQ